VYAPQLVSAPAAIAVRLIGDLDADLVDAFVAIERGLARPQETTLIVDVRDLCVIGARAIAALVAAIVGARAAGRDVRLDGRSGPWKRALSRQLAEQPPVEPTLMQTVRRTVVVAHTTRRRRR
jgi:anti-anti-sigma regulatory factor